MDGELIPISIVDWFVVSVVYPAVIFILASDHLVEAAIVAGVFSIINTVLNARILRHITSTKKEARQSMRELRTMAEENGDSQNQ